ncbi:MAG: TetR/AcrR family transcriptional regulator, partial [Corynebacterium sp.]|nr:TetR/AcrR family transcriptional regulator [Corynebacterium sp.]
MPRINKKTAALEAALDIIAAEDVSGLTYDSLAQATGMSKSGLIYHFPTRHNLLVDCHRFCAERWEEELEQLAGGHPASELSLAERSRALVLSMGKKDPLVKLLMCVHSQTHPDFSAQWADVDARWMVDPSAAETDEDDLLVMLLS